MDAAGRDIAGVVAAHRRLETAIASLTDTQVRSASLLEGWTVGHVLTHLARNADSYVRVLDGAARGETHERYPGGMDARDRAIAEGAVRSAVEIIDDVRTANAALERCWASFGGSLMPLPDVPHRRRREVEVHHADLGPSFGRRYGSWPADYRRAELRLLTMTWASRRPMGLTEFPDAVRRASDDDRLSWLLGRLVIDGVEPAGTMP